MSATSPFKTFRPITDEERARLEHEATMERLGRLVKDIASRRDFEDMVLQSVEPDAFRALVEPMLPAKLPCCIREAFEGHQSRCPNSPEARAARVVADA